MDNTNVDFKLIGKRIKDIRNSLNLSQEKLAERVDISVQHLSKIENGHKGMSLSTAIRIANVLDTSIDFLVHDNINNKTELFIAEISPILNDSKDDDILNLIRLIKLGKELINK